MHNVSNVRKSQQIPRLREITNQKRQNWTRVIMKRNFSNILFSEESRVALDGPDGWSKWCNC